MEIGDIIGEITSLDFDAYGGSLPKIIHVSGTTYAVAYQGYGNDGYVKTIPVQNDGSIGAVISSLEFDTVQGRYPSIVHISGDVYAIAYAGPANNGLIKTIHISNDGTIDPTIIDTYTFEAGGGVSQLAIVHISETTYAVFHGGPASDGWLKTITIQDDGTITGVINFLEFDVNYGMYSDPIHISGDVWANVYTADAIFGPGRIMTFTITGAGAIAAIASYDYDLNQSSAPDIFHISGNVYGIAYGGPGADGWLKTVTINNDGTIGGLISFLEFDTTYGANPYVVLIGSNVWAIAYDGPDGDGWLKTVTINDDGTIGGIVSTFEYDNASGRYQSMIHVNEDVYAIAYLGPGNDGWLKTIEITTSIPLLLINKSYALAREEM